MYATKTVKAAAELKADREGSLSAVFSTFGVVDADGDVLVREAFTDGQKVPLVWAHDWSRPVGRGTVRTDAERAIFDGHFFLETTDGRDAYETVKAMSDLQEFSWGFRILDASEEVRDGEPVRIITKAEVFEVSPVLVGSNPETGLLAIKARRRISRGQLEGAIAVLQALLGDETDDAEMEPEPPAASSAEPKGLDVACAELLMAAEDLTARLKNAATGDLAASRQPLEDLAKALGWARDAAERGIARAETYDELDAPALLREWQRLTGLYGPVHSRTAG